MMETNVYAHPTTPTKIGIVGPKQVGKTTLANLLNGHLKSLGVSSDLVHESARGCPLPLNEKTTIGAAYWLLGAQIAAEALVQETRQFTICDRTVIDLYPFALYSAIMIKANRESSAIADLQKLKILIKDYVSARPYEFLFYIPIRHELSKLYPPPDDPSFQTRIDEEFRKFLNELHMNHMELKSLDNYERRDEVMSLITKKYHFRRNA